MINYSVICPDANLVVRLVMNAQPDNPINTLWEGWYSSQSRLVAPSLIFYEVSNALHRYVVHGELTRDEAIEAFEVASQLGINTYRDDRIHLNALSMARDLAIPATYDAHYLAIALQFRAQFWTTDKRLYNSVQEKLDWVYHWHGTDTKQES